MLLAVYGITVGYRWFSTPEPDSAIGLSLTSSGVLSARDLAFVRANPTVPIERSPFRFTEIARTAGIGFVHVSGMTEGQHFPTANGSGVAMFDSTMTASSTSISRLTQLPAGNRHRVPNRL